MKIAFHIHLLFLFLIHSPASHQECGRSVVDSVPGLSQLKSLWQVANGDEKCAKQTQENFVRTAPVFSQMTSLVQAAQNNPEEAKKTQQMFLKNLEDQVDGTPLIGHAKGIYHYAQGDKEHGDQIMKDATRPIAVLAGATAAGPAGALAGGVAYDNLVTRIDSEVKDEFTPYGTFEMIHSIDNASPGELFDNGVSIIGDLSAKGKSAPRKTPIGQQRSRPSKNKGKKKPTNNDVKTNQKQEKWIPYKPRGKKQTVNIPYRNRVRWIHDYPIRPNENLLGPIEIIDGKFATRLVQQNPDANNRVEYVRAHITKENLDKGTETNKASRKYRDQMGHKDPRFSPDQAGHLVSKALGGDGGRSDNIIPQNSLFNDGAWKTQESMMKTFVDTNGEGFLNMRIFYPDSDGKLATRPSGWLYNFERFDGHIFYQGYIENPLIAEGFKTDYFK